MVGRSGGHSEIKGKHECGSKMKPGVVTVYKIHPIRCSVAARVSSDLGLSFLETNTEGNLSERTFVGSIQ